MIGLLLDIIVAADVDVDVDVDNDDVVDCSCCCCIAALCCFMSVHSIISSAFSSIRVALRDNILSKR
jgi:hypothetical protein